jgi:hypothetical protein
VTAPQGCVPILSGWPLVDFGTHPPLNGGAFRISVGQLRAVAPHHNPAPSRLSPRGDPATLNVVLFGRSGFSRDLLRHRRQKVWDCRGRLHLWPLGSRRRKVRGESPSYQKGRCLLVGAASAATLASSKAEGLGLQGASSSVAFGVSKTESSGRKPLLPKRTILFIVLVGAALAATLAPSKAEGSGWRGRPSSVAFGILKAGGSGRKPLLPKRTVASSKPWGSGGRPRLGAGEGRPRKDHSGGLGCAA